MPGYSSPRRCAGQLHPTASPSRLSHRRWLPRWPIWCSRPRPARLHGAHHLLPILVRFSSSNNLFTYLTTTYRCNIVPLFGAYVADTHWGRFKTISVSMAIALLGHIIMIISSVPGVIEEKSAVAVFAVSLLVTGFGTGGLKANISTLIAEQYTRTKMFVTTTKSGERVIVDPALTISRIYMVRACIPCRSPLSHRNAGPVLLSLHQCRCSHRPSPNDLCREGSFPLMASVFSNPTLL